jgi:hypothetical protein
MASADVDDLFNEWNMSVGFMFGNEELYTADERMNVLAAITLGGFFMNNFEGSFSGKILNAGDFKAKEGSDERESATAWAVQALARYHFSEKFALGARVAYTCDDDGIGFRNDNAFGTLPTEYFGLQGLDFGIVCEYNPTPFTYVRLEGNLLNLSNPDSDDYAKMFLTGDDAGNIDDYSAMRMGIALSMGFKFDLFNRTIE